MRITNPVGLCAILTSVMLLMTYPLRDACADESKDAAFRYIDQNRGSFERAALAIHGFAETRLREYRSSAYLADMLEEAGFDVERGVAGLPTAFVAVYGSGEPVVGILAEYDALPGLSQKPGVPFRDPVEEGGAGHGCGHNLFGAASTAAAMAVKAAVDDGSVSGTVKLFGCPAEEGTIGKVYMARDGVFDGLDACFVWHPSSRNRVHLGSSLAKNEFYVTFRGKTAHAAGDPHNGRSALDAAELMNLGVNYLREHVREKVRIHYVYKDGGMAPNIVPEMARVWYYVRSINREAVDDVYARVLKCAEGAALMTGTDYEIEFVTGVYSYLPNRTLSEVVHRNLTLVGAPRFDDGDRAFAHAVQQALGAEQREPVTEIEPLSEPTGPSGGSTDVADVSRIVPTSGELGVATIAPGSPGHSWAVTACSGSPMGMKGMIVAAKVLAASALDVMNDPEIAEAARIEFEKATEGFVYKSAVPEGQGPPIPENEK